MIVECENNIEDGRYLEPIDGYVMIKRITWYKNNHIMEELEDIEVIESKIVEVRRKEVEMSEEEMNEVLSGWRQ